MSKETRFWSVLNEGGEGYCPVKAEKGPDMTDPMMIQIEIDDLEYRAQNLRNSGNSDEHIQAKIAALRGTQS